MSNADAAPRNIILFADGTGNSAGALFKTNVWRLYQALDLGCQDQIATFSDGVGTSSFKPFEMIGLALGFGVKRRVINLYKFLCLNYKPGDRIFIFGFSRGAFTVRLVVGLVAREGLVEFQSHEELERNALAAYRSYRAKAFPAKWPWTKWARQLRNATVSGWNWLTGSRSYPACRPEITSDRSSEKIRVAFLGVWDTVAAYGLPIDELTKAVDRWVWPLTFEKSSLLPVVDRACQALSLDDERRTFFPIPWNNKDDKGIIGGDRLLQVWFAGVHANIGGGYPDDRLAHIPLCWMIGEAQKSGLKFKHDIVQQYKDIASENGRIYDSRANFGVFYRYHPRSVHALLRGPKAIVDCSVLARMVNGPDGYAPISLGQEFSVRDPNGYLHDFPPKTGLMPSPFTDGDDQFNRDFRALAERLAGEESATERIELVQDTVWWRRANYYVSLVLVVLAAAYPFFSEYVSSGTISQLDDSARLVVGWLVGILRLLVPGFAEPWLNAIARRPTAAALLISATIASIWLGRFLQTRIADRARIAWSNGNWSENQAHFEKEMRISQKRLTSAVAAIGSIASLVAVATGTGRAAIAFAVIAVCALLLRFATDRKTKASQRISFLRFARKIRKNKYALRLYHLLRVFILPASALAVTALFVLIVLNKASVEMTSAAGVFCGEVESAGHLAADPVRSVVFTDFDLKSMCWRTGVIVEKGERYRITIAMLEDRPWKDADIASGVAGFSSESLLHTIGVPLRRWWGYPYFQPIARIGNRGANEKPLEPIRLRGGSAVAVKSAQFIFEPDETGRLYLYLNDAAIGIPGVYGFFYENNQGGAKITVENVSGY